MGIFSRNDETAKLADTVADLPKEVATWTPEQLTTFTNQSNRAMREQNGIDPNAS
ncbi:hypothetical protein [Streptomyces sp. NBC_00035]|uniref:hypothetical protein n=1 Tax=Streptomyces sp. NBC_00035 TaxID=2903614 RepID=UPI0032556037